MSESFGIRGNPVRFKGKGNVQGTGSDIDIAVAGASEFEGLREEIESLPTLYTVDLVNLDECNNQMLLEDIERVWTRNL